MKLTKLKIFWLISSCLVIGSTPVHAQNKVSITDEERYEIRQTCRKFYPTALDVIDYYQCLSRREKEAIDRKVAAQRYEENQRRQAQERFEEERRQSARIEASRSCINNNINFIEAKLRDAKSLIRRSDNLDRVRTNLDRHFSASGSVIPSSSRIGTNVYVVRVYFPCDSDFHFLVNVDANHNGIGSYSVWSQKPLDTYKKGTAASGFVAEFSRDFETEFLATKVNLTSLRFACSRSSDCFSYSISFRLRNVANVPLKNFDFSAFFTEANRGLVCPQNKAVIRLTDTLAPGEARDFSFVQNYGSNKNLPYGLSDIGGMMMCFDIKTAEEAK
jgi:hypothetical protein